MIMRFDRSLTAFMIGCVLTTTQAAQLGSGPPCFGGTAVAAVLLVGRMASDGSSAASSASPALPASLPAGDDGPNNHLIGGPLDVHHLIIDETAPVFAQGRQEGTRVTEDPAGVLLDAASPNAGDPGPVRIGLHTSRIIRLPFPINEFVPSCNIDVPAGCGYTVEVRLGRAPEGIWTPFYYLGSWGDNPTPESRVTGDVHGLVDIDCFRSRQLFELIQYRVRLASSAPDVSPALRRFALAVSNTTQDADLAARFRRPVDPGPPAGWTRRLPVPFRSQKVEPRELRGRICSPTSVAMVLQYYGVDRPTLEVAQVIYDPEYRLYGNWGRAIQGAYTLGVPGYLERFGDWNAVQRYIAQGRPIIASIRAEEGELIGAPYRSTDGHLIVVVGFDEAGNVHVNDPSGDDPGEGIVTYPREGMEKAWFGHGGLGYVLLGTATNKLPG